MNTNSDLSKKPVRSVTMVHNRPAILMDGKDLVPVVYALSDFPAANSNTYQAHKNVRAFAKQGINLVSCDTNLALGWYKHFEWEYEALQYELTYVLDANPNAQILLRLHVNPPYWWLRDHPEEQMLYRFPDGDRLGIDNGESDRMIRNDSKKQMHVSTASKLWREEAGQRLRGFLNFIKDKPERKHLMAIQIAEGLFGEWHQVGTDVSENMVRYFREEYLPETYKTNENLQKAWNDPNVTFETAPFHPEIHYPADDGCFRDPQKSRFVMDAQKCIQKSNVEAILHFCRIIKEEMGDEILAGAFYTYYLYGASPIGGHLRPDLLFGEKGIVDFVCGPMPYAANRTPEGVPMQRGLLESTRLNGRLWLNEMDQHPEGIVEFPCGGDPEKIGITIALMRRNIFMTILAGHGSWFYDHRKGAFNRTVYRKSGWWDNEILMKDIGKMYSVIEEYHLKPFEPVADVLFVYDTDKFFVRSENNEMQHEVYASFLRAGVAADTIYLKDFGKCDIDRYRIVIFTNAYLLTPDELEKIKTLTRGKQVVWLETPGYCDGETLNRAHTEALLEMKLKKHPAVKGYTTEGILGNETVEDTIGESDWRTSVIDTDDIEVLARYETGAAAAAKKGGTWFFASPMLTPEIALPIVEKSGAHRYCEDKGISVLADNRMVLIYTTTDGEKTVKLRNGKTVKKSLKAFTSLVLDAETGEILMD